MSKLKVIFHFLLRVTQGLVHSMIELLSLTIETPNYTTLSRRQISLAVSLSAKLPKGPIHVVVDATGLKLNGESEWKVHLHGYGK